MADCGPVPAAEFLPSVLPLLVLGLVNVGLLSSLLDHRGRYSCAVGPRCTFWASRNTPLYFREISVKYGRILRKYRGLRSRNALKTY